MQFLNSEASVFTYFIFLERGIWYQMISMSVKCCGCQCPLIAPVSMNMFKILFIKSLVMTVRCADSEHLVFLHKQPTPFNHISVIHNFFSIHFHKLLMNMFVFINPITDCTSKLLKGLVIDIECCTT